MACRCTDGPKAPHAVGTEYIVTLTSPELRKAKPALNHTNGFVMCCRSPACESALRSGVIADNFKRILEDNNRRAKFNSLLDHVLQKCTRFILPKASDIRNKNIIKSKGLEHLL